MLKLTMTQSGQLFAISLGRTPIEPPLSASRVSAGVVPQPAAIGKYVSRGSKLQYEALRVGISGNQARGHAQSDHTMRARTHQAALCVLIASAKAM